MSRQALAVCLLGLGLSACVEMDESTYIKDDAGKIHHTVHYTKDKRGKNVFPLKKNATGKREFIFSPAHSSWAAYDEQGERVMTGSASGGKDFCEDANEPCRTISGVFHVYNKRGENCRSGEYPVETTGGARMPYCIYFYRGFTIHAGYEVPEHPTSHGCIRVFPSAAKWLNEEFIRIGTKVTVLDYPPDEEQEKVDSPVG